MAKNWVFCLTNYTKHNTSSKEHLVFTSHTTGDQIFYFVHHVLHILHIYFSGARFGCQAYARGLDYSGRTRRLSPRLSHHLVDRVHHQPTGRSVRRSLLLGVHFTADQLVGLLGAHRLVIPAIRHLDFIVSCARCSPAELGTSRCLDSSCNFRQLS
jgi:hypothetical protein